MIQIQNHATVWILQLNEISNFEMAVHESLCRVSQFCWKLWRSILSHKQFDRNSSSQTHIPKMHHHLVSPRISFDPTTTHFSPTHDVDRIIAFHQIALPLRWRAVVSYCQCEVGVRVTATIAMSLKRVSMTSRSSSWSPQKISVADCSKNQILFSGVVRHWFNVLVVDRQLQKNVVLVLGCRIECTCREWACLRECCWSLVKYYLDNYFSCIWPVVSKIEPVNCFREHSSGKNCFVYQLATI